MPAQTGSSYLNVNSRRLLIHGPQIRWSPTNADLTAELSSVSPRRSALTLRRVASRTPNDYPAVKPLSQPSISAADNTNILVAMRPRKRLMKNVIFSSVYLNNRQNLLTSLILQSRMSPLQCRILAVEDERYLGSGMVRYGGTRDLRSAQRDEFDRNVCFYEVAKQT